MLAITSELSFLPTIFTGAAMGIGCAVLSVFVVSRRWAFMGEGISHAGFGGAGVAWLLALAYPALDANWMVSISVVACCLGTALAIAWVTREDRVNSDAVIGIFLVGTLAFGFLASEIYRRARGAAPAGFENLLFGHFSGLSYPDMWGAILVCAAVLTVVAVLWKEILYYCFDPAMAQASGVRAGFIHYLLTILVTIAIVFGIRLAGSLLVTALLILPGATALLLSNRLHRVITIAISIGVIGAVGGLLLHLATSLPAGPMIVLVLFVQFLISYGWISVRRTVA